MPLWSRALPVVATALLGAVSLTACEPSTSSPLGASRAPSSSSWASPQTGTALALLTTLEVKGRAAKTGYSRSQFGQAWADADRNGCDQRNDVLRRDLSNEQLKPGTRGCVVLSGDLADPYTATAIHFVRGDGNLIDIDHVIALGNAWVTGAATWPARKRVALATDFTNLLAVDATSNRQKGDGDAATWLPSNRAYRCAYVARQVRVKAKYGLWVTPAEKAAIARVLNGCPEQPPAPAGPLPTIAAIDGGTSSSSTSSLRPRSGSVPTQTTGTDPRFGTCSDAKANGYGPYSRDKDPEFVWYQDRDGDGVVCE